MKDDEPWVLDDPGKLKALAHPMRRAMLRHLGLHGPATSTTLGSLLDAKTGTTSYHLRQLEKYGFIEEIPERSTGRERWWRRAETGDIRLPLPAQLAPGDRPVLAEFHRIGLEEDKQILLEQLPAAYQADPAWVKVSRALGRMRLDELEDFFEEYILLLKKYGRRAADAPPEARPLHIRLLAVPADLPATPDV
ncbi:helix-turn-helix domain-containing protein [Nonomuraea sp. NPDC003804]|uniref:ArsR/SmtB family transcription factor n=1 Tax=Nonomuraea sp. NPDC003804 TaxID=3154547 RepID=UPI00339E276F